MTWQVVAQWLVLAGLTGIITFILWRKQKLDIIVAGALPLFVFYLLFTLYVTIYDRSPGTQYQYMLEVFWSYKKAMAGFTSLYAENFWNVVLFIPIGFLLSLLVPRRWAVPFIALGLSAEIELTQLVFKLGLFEFDDMIHNTLGAVIGVLVFLAARAIIKASAPEK